MAKLSFFEATTKSQATLLLFLVLLLVVPVLFARPHTELSKSSMANSSSSSSSSMEFHPKEPANGNITHQHLGASAHEVPSGPNPDSNK
ncbi:CLAVATA3/ESR (CLE)-related protein 41-like [Ziziphus jujuba]|uniref:CLAVATA3/ESR (CLE)-related protein 41-like n=1 Tax=Ziziphus jujuba TaxID=326968 RepID=A0ABM4A3N7_ZIZJJ|nr:CLAVATA3/ESR (CLE)-related protein 41-like [Ziziphus jujuba]